MITDGWDGVIFHQWSFISSAVRAAIIVNILNLWRISKTNNSFSKFEFSKTATDRLTSLWAGITSILFISSVWLQLDFIISGRPCGRDYLMLVKEIPVLMKFILFLRLFQITINWPKRKAVRYPFLLYKIFCSLWIDKPIKQVIFCILREGTTGRSVLILPWVSFINTLA